MDSKDGGVREKIYGVGLLVGIGEHPRMYTITVGTDEDNNVVFIVTGDEKMRMRVFKGKISVEDISEMLDKVVREIMEEDRLAFVELMAGTGVLRLTYMRRAVWA